MDDKVIDIEICVIQAKILKGVKSEPFFTIAKLELGESSLGTSTKQELREDNTFEYLLTSNIQCQSNNGYAIDDLISKPLLVSIYEVSATAKKTKDDKVLPMCICAIDLLPLITGNELSIKKSYPLHFIESQKQATPIQPEVEMEFTFSGHVISEDVKLKDGNILQITMESCFSVPDSLISSPTDVFFTGFMFPLFNENEEMVLFRNGHFENPPETKPVPKKWYQMGTALGESAFIPDSYLDNFDIEDDVGDLQSDACLERRKTAEAAARITWNIEKRAVMLPSAVEKLRKIISENQILPVEFVKISGSNQKGKKDDDPSYTSHYAVAYVNLSPLIFPGVNEIHGAYNLYPLNEVELKTKTNRKSLFIGGTASRSPSTIFSNAMSRKVVTPSKDMNAPNAQAKQKLTSGRSSQSTINGTSHPYNILELFTPESAIFDNSKSYIIISFKVRNPLTAKRPMEDVVEKILELIPPRSSFPKKLNSANKAVEEFNKQICNVSALILEEYKSHIFKDIVAFQSRDSLGGTEFRKKKFLQDLKKSGKFFACLEQIKYCIIKVVREKFLKKNAFNTKQEMEEFVSTLYVFLIEEMHHSLNQYLSVNDLSPVPPPVPELQQLKAFADDAFALGELELAEKYCLQRIARQKNSPESWIDCGIFYLAVKKYTKAAECFKEAISLVSDHFYGLLLFGISCEITERQEDAELFFVAATEISPNNILAFTSLGLHYDKLGEENGARLNFKKAEKLLREIQQNPTSAIASVNIIKISPHSSERGQVKRRDSLLEESDRRTNIANHFNKVAPVYLQWNALEFAELAISRVLALEFSNLSIDYFINMGKLQLKKKNYIEAEAALTKAAEKDFMNPDVWSLLGHVYYESNNTSKAMKNYQRAIGLSQPPHDIHIVYMRLGNIAINDKKFFDAKKFYLKACKYSPSCMSWLGVGKACFKMEEMQEAEDSLSEANILDNTNPEVWAYLTMVCLKTNRKDEAEQAYRYTCKCELKNPVLVNQIHQLEEETGNLISIF